MRPMKSATPFAIWLMRFALLTFIFLAFFGEIQRWNFTDLNYLISFAYVAFAFLLVVGGFIPGTGLTTLSGLLLFIVSVIKIVLLFLDHKTFTNEMGLYLLLGAISFYFFAKGDQY